MPENTSLPRSQRRRRTPLQIATQALANEVRALGATGTVRELHVLRDIADRIFAAELARKTA
jgi:hypothetical protein